MILVETTDQAADLAAQLGTYSGVVAIDSETVGLDPSVEPASSGKARIVCWSLSWADIDAFIWMDCTDPLLPWLRGPAPKVGHNITYDWHAFLNHDIELGGTLYDTMRMHQLYNTLKGARHGLKDLIPYWGGYKHVGAYKDLFSIRRHVHEDLGNWKYTWRKVDGIRVRTLRGGASTKVYTGRDLLPLDKVRTEHQWLLPTLYKYACLDTRACLDLWLKLEPCVRSMLNGGTPRLDASPAWKERGLPSTGQRAKQLRQPQLSTSKFAQLSGKLSSRPSAPRPPNK